MIFTRMGNGVEITKANEDGTVDIKFLAYDDTRRGVGVFDLVADKGIEEIQEAINKALDK